MGTRLLKTKERSQKNIRSFRLRFDPIAACNHQLIASRSGFIIVH